ncbi:MAG: Lrp/AsnC family transcriptional regulator [Actinobacteria bacterium]|nr:Lrp/AsnC family transcriptional regulator [Actinomycetota bacterium]
MSITALIMINAEPGAIAELGTQLADIDGITEAHSVAGGDVDLVAIAKVETHDDIAKVVTEGISKLSGILNTNTLIAFRSYSTQAIDAAFEGFGD